MQRGRRPDDRTRLSQPRLEIPFRQTNLKRMTSKAKLHNATKEPARVVFVNRFYSPDISATSQILTDVAESLSDLHTVNVYTSQMSYNSDASYQPREVLNGVRIHRVWSTRFGRQSTIGRAFDYVTFYLSVSISLLIRLQKADILVAKTDPPLLSVPLGLIARFKKARLVNWLQDVFPEVAQNLGVGAPNSRIMKTLRNLRTRSLLRARTNVAIGHCMRDRLNDLGVPSERITVIGNFVDDGAITPLLQGSPALRQEWGFEHNDFVIGYSGNLGRAHDIETILEVAASVKNLPDVKFLFVGGGHLHGLLEHEIEARGLSNIVLRPYQPRIRLSETLALPDLHWASLKPKLEGYIVPSKLYGVAAAGRPLLMIGEPSGEIGRFLDSHQFGKCIVPGDVESAKQFILELRQNREERSALGINARRFLEEIGSREKALAAWRSLIEELQIDR